jgi:hypothetical protein
MQPIHHKYPSFTEFFTIAFNIFGFLFPLFTFFYPLFEAIAHHAPITFEGIAVFLFLAIFAGVCIFLAGNFYSEIVSDRDGLHINFLWKHLVVPWEDIIDIKPMFNIPFLKGHWVIKTRSLTFFHRLYGLLYGFSPYPSVVFSKGISNYEELSRRIRTKLRKKQKK